MTAPVEQLRSLNGSQYGTASGISGAQLATTGGCIGQLIVLTSGTGTGFVYDSANGTSGGNIIFTVPASTAQSTIYALNIPFQNGLFIKPNSSAVLLATYNVND